MLGNISWCLFCFVLGGSGDSSVRADDGYVSVFKIYFRSQQLHFSPGIIITSIPIWPLPTLTGDSQYFKLGGGVLYHCTSGWICHTPGQDPSHSDDDITQYMQQGLLQPMVYSSEEVLPSICPFASVWIASVQATHCRQSVPLAIIHGSCDLSLTCGTYHCGENVENAVEEMDNRILKETECHLETIEVPHMEKGI